MQIQRVQSNQQTFGTKVFVDSELVKLWQKSKAHSKEFIEYTAKLENNGVNDILYLSKVMSSEGIYGAEASVNHIKDNQFYLSKNTTYDAIEYRDDFKTHCVDLVSMYNECRKSMSLLIDSTKNFMDNFLNKL